MAADPLPNLKGTVAVTVRSLGDNAEVTFDLSIQNAGNAECTKQLYIDLWSQYPCACNVNPLKCGGLGSSDFTWEFANPAQDFKAGTTKKLSFKRTMPFQALPYRFMLSIDSYPEGGTCTESKKLDNLICGDYKVEGSASSADLVLTNCQVTPDPENPTVLVFSATVTNQGTAATEEATEVDLFLEEGEVGTCLDHQGQVGAGFAEVPTGLEPGGSVEILETLADLPAGTYTPTFVVNGFHNFPETLLDNNCCDAGGTFEFDPPENWFAPDFIVKAFEARLQANKLVFEGTIKNIGHQEVTTDMPHKLCIFKDWADRPAYCETPDPEKNNGWILEFTDGLDINAEVPFNLSGGKITNGLHTFWARADCDCHIPEVDEKNNDFREDLLVDLPGPDLAIEKFTANQEPDGASYQVHYQVKVINRGQDPANLPFDVDVFFDTETLPSWENADLFVGDYQSFPVGLAPGASALLHFYWAPPPEEPTRQYTAWAVVDITDSIFETAENNNAVSYPMVLEGTGTTEGVNLLVQQFSATVRGTTVTYYLEVKNTGEDDILTAFRLDLFHDADTQPDLFEWGDQSETIFGLKSGEVLTRYLEWKDGVPDGLYQSYVFVDSDNAVQETAEGDNVAGPRLSQVCATCAACGDNQILSSACVCGDETVFTGFCCQGEWFAVGCPYGADTDQDAGNLNDVGGDGGDTGPSDFGGSGGGCGCMTAGPQGPTTTGLLGSLLLLLLATLLVRRQTH
jgi:hypothetical protein